MFKHYLQVVLRKFSRAPLLAAINVLALTLGLVSFLAAYGVVGFWSRAEGHFANSSRTYVVTQNITLVGDYPRREQLAESNPNIARYLETDFPAIEAVARAWIATTPELVAAGDRVVSLLDVSVDSGFLSIFDLPFVSGDSRQALSRPRSAVLTRDTAVRLFGSDEPMGRSLLLRNSLEVTVTGVIDSIPEPSHMGRSPTAVLRFDLLTSMDVYEHFETSARDPRAPPPPENWIGGGVMTYVLLPSSGSLTSAALQQQLADFVRRHVPPGQLELARIYLEIAPVGQILSLASTATRMLGRTGLTAPTAILVLGFLVLAVACVNYASLAVARAASRVRDVGVRKALGARASQIGMQHLVESAVLAVLALLAALVVIAVSAPVIKTAIGVDISLELSEAPRTWLELGAVLALVVVAAGACPAYVLSRFPPATSLRTANLRKSSLVTVLVGAQFAVASFLIVLVTVAHLQNQDLRRSGLGAVSDPVLVIHNDPAVTKVAAGVLRTELRRVPGVAAVGYTAWSPWTMHTIMPMSLSAEETAADRPTFRYIAGYGFFDAMQIPAIAGRVFESSFNDNPTLDGPWNVVVDRAFVDEFQLGPPEDAVGRTIYIPKRLLAAFGRSSAQPLRIIGVVETQPLAFLGLAEAHSTVYTFGDRLPFLVARLSKNDVGPAMDAIDAVWASLAPGLPMDRRFLDEAFGEQYESFEQFSQTFGILAALAIVISSIGLCAMAILVASARVREIGVRKIFGAPTWKMIGLLMGGFSIPVMVANLVALPFAFGAASLYLDRFIYPIDLTPAPFVASFAATVLIACVVVAGQAWRAAASNPASVLRLE